jgi:hypothetical protein
MSSIGLTGLACEFLHKKPGNWRHDAVAARDKLIRLTTRVQLQRQHGRHTEAGAELRNIDGQQRYQRWIAL